ncbi:MAG: ABC transporter permease subunit [Armatimonadota bacterium]
MVRDILTVIQKEMWEYWQMRGSKAPWRGHLFAIILFSIWPAMSGAVLMGSPWCALMWAWIVTIMTTPYVADSFAGERERHTMDTLLSSRLSDGAIVVGKLLSASLCSWMTGMASLPIAVLLANLLSPNHSVHLHPTVWFTAPILALSMAFMVAGYTSIVVVKAVTVKQATQTASYGTIFIIIIPLLAMRFLPQHTVQQFMASLGKLHPVPVLLSASAIAVVVGMISSAFGLMRFSGLRKDGA